MTKVVSYHLTLIFTCEVEGGYTVNCKELPELITGGDTFDEALENVKDALEATIELYEDFNRELPKSVVSYHFSEEVGNGIEKLIEAVVPMSYNIALNYKDLTKILRKAGCMPVKRRTRGSHRKWKNPKNNKTASIPDWGKKDLKPGIISSTLKQLEVDLEDK